MSQRKRPAPEVAPVAAAKKKKKTTVMPYQVAHRFVRVHEGHLLGADDLDTLRLPEGSFDDALPDQRKGLRKLYQEKGLPPWLVVTRGGLLCSSCILATNKGCFAPKSNVGDDTAWIRRYVQRGDVATCTKQHEHGQGAGLSSTSHKHLADALNELTKAAVNFETAAVAAIDKEETAIKKRLAVLLHVVEQNYPLSKYATELHFLNRNGGLSDCPAASERGSISSKSANYTSDRIRAEFLAALADALYTLVHRLVKSSPAVAFALDETMDASMKSQLAIMYRVLIAGQTRMIYAGMTDLQRGTAEFTLAGLQLFLDRDGIPWEDVGSGCCDTCNVMFGSVSGLFARIQLNAPWVWGQRCCAHTAALGVLHGVQSLPLVRNAVDTLKMMGVMDGASSRRHEFYSEAIEVLSAVDPTFESNFDGLVHKIAPTRWPSIGRAVDKLAESEDNYAVSVLAQVRHGAGDGENGLYIVDAGNSNVTAAGLAHQIKREEFLAIVLFLKKAMRPITTVVKKLQQQNIGFDGYMHALETCITEIELLTTESAAHAAGVELPKPEHNLSSWRNFADRVRAILATAQMDLVRDRRRPAHAIDTLLMQAKESLLGAMREYQPDTELLKHLRTLFDASLLNGVAPLSTEVLDDHYSDALVFIFEHYDPCYAHGDGDSEDEEKVLFAKLDIQRDHEGFRTRYIALYRSRAGVVLKHENLRNEKAHAARSKRQEKKNRTEFVPRTAATVESIMQDIMGLSEGAQLFAEHKVMHKFAAFYLTAMVSQATVESFFSHLKLVVSSRRTTLNEETKGQIMYLLLNGPNGRCGQHLNIMHDDIVDLAYKIWKDGEKTKRLVGQRFRVDPNREGFNYRKGQWGARPNPAAAQEAAEHDVLAKLDAARKRRAAVQAFMSDRLVEEAEAAARLEYDKIVNSNDESQIALFTFAAEESGQSVGVEDENEQRREERMWIKSMEPLPSTAEELALEACIAEGATAEDVAKCRAAERVGLVYRDVVPQLSDHPTGVTVGDEVAVTGFGGCVWYSGKVVAQTTVTAARKKAKSARVREPEFTILFSADCKRVVMPLPAKLYGSAKVHVNSNGVKKAGTGWYILGTAVPTAVPEKFGGAVIDGGRLGGRSTDSESI